MSDKRLEALAALEHEQWAHWTKHMLETLRPYLTGHADSHVLIGRWLRQIEMSYDQLSEDEKESDRVWARKAMAIVGIAEGDDILTPDEWAWVSVMLDEIEERGADEDEYEVHDRLAARFGEEKAEEIHDYVQKLVQEEEGT